MSMNAAKHILVTGGAGFIGSNFVEMMAKMGHRLTIIDALTYAGHRQSIEPFLIKGHVDLVVGDIGDPTILEKLFSENHFSSIVNFAAESHVDNSILGPKVFLQTNIMGTFQLLEAARRYWNDLGEDNKKDFRFVHVSTDEVFGSLGETGKFTESSRYEPNSPYSASKAASDHLARAWFHTYQLPVIITNCSNNYGPRQFPEKLIPLMINNCLRGKKLPVYGTGTNIRDWIHVEDHNQGVFLALTKGTPGEVYCFGGNSERNNLEVVKAICQILDAKKPGKDGQSYESLISFVTDRKGHDFRYAIDDAKAQKELGFKRKYTFKDGIEATVAWYLENSVWMESVLKKSKGSEK
jgi:dTDP-glucose 4,6-dehydratase